MAHDRIAARVAARMKFSVRNGEDTADAKALSCRKSNGLLLLGNELICNKAKRRQEKGHSQRKLGAQRKPAPRSGARSGGCLNVHKPPLSRP